MDALTQIEHLYNVALFAGAGGGELASQWLKLWTTICYVEYEPSAVEMLKARIADGALDDAPIWGDVRSFTKRNNQTRRFIRSLRQIRHRLVITAGFPCQPFSTAGLGLRENDPRNGWPDTIRIIREIRPAYVFLENVPGLLTGPKQRVRIQWVDRTLFGKERRSREERISFPSYFGNVLGELSQVGYDAQWGVVSANDAGANHKRERVWILGSNSKRFTGSAEQKSEHQLAKELA